MEAVGFFGLKILPDKLYCQLVEDTFRLTMATLDDSLVEACTDSSKTSLYVSVNGEDVILCSLIPDKVTQQPLDITFVKGDRIMFSLLGTHTVQLTGNYLRTAKHDVDEVEDNEDLDSDVMDEDELKSLLEVYGSNEDDDSDVDRDIKDDGSEGRVQVDSGRDPQSKMYFIDTSDCSSDQQNASTLTKRKFAATTSELEQLQAQNAEHFADIDKEHQLANGLIIENKLIGSGAQVKNGMKIGILYIGKFVNGKEFSNSPSHGEPLVFTLGKGEVIKGVDLGIVDMNLYGIRKLTIPPSLAYGKEGDPPRIPENATLTLYILLVSMEHSL
ncbi:hypothetical protein BCR42DRAFT_413824 [Absidia repens]|uniref:peptidylprolyl isomerase n=1 Tax=Absidia repens TaxID=90262 RepID=A0A1X2II56_9FUNG|nr:hypothetical protein BCR42DRAFT_413824 [Absidia repens]